MQLGDGADEPEPQPVPRRAPAAFKPNETVEYSAAPVRRYARAGIANLDMRFAGTCLDAESAFPFGRVFERVVEQIGDRLREQMAIAAHHDVIGDPGLEAKTALIGDRLVKFGDVARDLGKIDRLETVTARSGFGFGNAQQGVECPEQAIGLVD